MVTTIIPTYNRAGLLMTRALPSVLAQADPDLEVLVVGDGTDEETVEAMAGVTDPRVRFWNRRRSVYPKDPRKRWRVAPLDAINFALRKARGEWISILADDDAYESDHHRRLLASSFGADVVYGQSNVVYGRAIQYERIYGARWPPHHLDICQGAYIMRRAVVPHVTRSQCATLGWDGVWWLAVIESGARFARVDAVVHRFYPEW